MVQYCIDTSALLDVAVRWYPMDVFGPLWVYFDEMIECGDLLAPDEVLRELSKKVDDVYHWADARPKLFYAIDEPLQTVLNDVIAEFPSFVDETTGRNRADPWVIALAKMTGRVVITGEKNNGTARKPKIPGVCNHFGVKYVDIPQFIRDQKITFQLVRNNSESS